MTNFLAIVRLLEGAADAKKYPKIKFEKYTLSRSKGGKYPGWVYINAPGGFGAGWYGRISPQGELALNHYLPYPGLEQELARFAADPAKYAGEYGRRTGNCCFCGLELTDKRSLSVGYGPVCAEKYHLPWGNELSEPEPQPQETSTPTDSPKAKDLGYSLAGFTGSECLYSYKLPGQEKELFRYTEGIQYLARTAECYWLLYAIASHQSQLTKHPFQIWTLEVSDKRGMLKCEWDTDEVILTQKIKYTDFPMPKIKLYYSEDILLLPSER